MRRRRHLKAVGKEMKTDFSKTLPAKKEHKLDLSVKMLLAR
jgi:hypothetical protein